MSKLWTPQVSVQAQEPKVRSRQLVVHADCLEQTCEGIMLAEACLWKGQS